MALLNIESYLVGTPVSHQIGFSVYLKENICKHLKFGWNEKNSLTVCTIISGIKFLCKILINLVWQKIFEDFLEIIKKHSSNGFQ